MDTSGMGAVAAQGPEMLAAYEQLGMIQNQNSLDKAIGEAFHVT